MQRPLEDAVGSCLRRCRKRSAAQGSHQAWASTRCAIYCFVSAALLRDFNGKEGHTATAKKHPTIRETPSKKVEYIELIYDLIFVFLLQRDNSLFEPGPDGFFSWSTFDVYVCSSLIVLQVWVFSVMYINRYGENTLKDRLFLCANMYLLYYMGVNTQQNWGKGYATINIAWAIILINIAVQYLLQARKVGPRHPDAKRLTHARAILYFADAGMVLLTIPIFNATGVSLVWPVLLVSLISPFFLTNIESALPISFEHLSERVMLFVVFTFGEMVVGISRYFAGGVTLERVYFSLVVFVTVMALFMSYGYQYNHVWNRHRHNSAKIFLLIHVLVVLALCDISVCLEYMGSPEINQMEFSVFLAANILVYFLCLHIIAMRASKVKQSHPRFTALALVAAVIFFTAVVLAAQRPGVVMAICAVYAAMQYVIIVLRWHAAHRKETERRKHEEAHA